jgi:hypothetical protein
MRGLRWLTVKRNRNEFGDIDCNRRRSEREIGAAR